MLLITCLWEEMMVAVLVQKPEDAVRLIKKALNYVCLTPPPQMCFKKVVVAAAAPAKPAKVASPKPVAKVAIHNQNRSSINCGRAPSPKPGEVEKIYYNAEKDHPNSVVKAASTKRLRQLSLLPKKRSKTSKGGFRIKYKC